VWLLGSQWVLLWETKLDRPSVPLMVPQRGTKLVQLLGSPWVSPWVMQLVTLLEPLWEQPTVPRLGWQTVLLKVLLKVTQWELPTVLLWVKQSAIQLGWPMVRPMVLLKVKS